MTRFLLAAFAAGILTVVVAMTLLQGLASFPNSSAATLREDDLVTLMEAAFSAGLAAFSIWAMRTQWPWLATCRVHFARASIVLTAVWSFAALALLGFFIERRFAQSSQSPSLRSLLPALLAAAALALWQRRGSLIHEREAHGDR